MATPTYRIRKEKKTGVLVSPKEVIELTPVNNTEPTVQGSSSSSSFVTSEQFLAMLDKFAKQFAKMKALLSRGNIFTTLKTSVQQVPSQQLLSDTPFLAPSAQLTGPVESPSVLDDYRKSKKEDSKDKKEGRKSCKDKDT